MLNKNLRMVIPDGLLNDALYCWEDPAMRLKVTIRNGVMTLIVVPTFEMSEYLLQKLKLILDGQKDGEYVLGVHASGKRWLSWNGRMVRREGVLTSVGVWELFQMAKKLSLQQAWCIEIEVPKLRKRIHTAVRIAMQDKKSHGNCCFHPIHLGAKVLKKDGRLLFRIGPEFLALFEHQGRLSDFLPLWQKMMKVVFHRLIAEEFWVILFEDPYESIWEFGFRLPQARFAEL